MGEYNYNKIYKFPIYNNKLYQKEFILYMKEVAR